MSVCLAAVDPGKVNPAVWLGLFDMNSGKIETKWGAAGQDITSAITDQNPTICEVGAKIGEMLVDKCKEMGLFSDINKDKDTSDHSDEKCLQGVVVETPSTFNGRGAFVNVGAAVGAGATFGYLRGVGIKNVKMSHSRTKSKAMDYFAESLGISENLEHHLPGVDKATKAKNRLVNKRNAKMIVAKLLEFSSDGSGQELLDKHHDKRDDLCDAVLLACGLGLDLFTVKKKRKSRVGGGEKKKEERMRKKKE